jgi:hypothetical protein
MRMVLTSIAAALMLTGSALAADPITGPEYSGMFEARVKNSGVAQVVQLERQTPVPRTKVRAFGYAGGESSLIVTGDRSPVRFAANTPVSFVVRVESQSKDPATLIQFVVLLKDKAGRKLTLATAGPLGLTSAVTGQKQNVAFHAVKHGQAFFLVTPDAPLPPGEYLLSTADSQAAFLFGID